MNNFGKLLMAAILGSVLTVGLISLIQGEEQTLTIEANPNITAQKTLFTMDSDGNVVPLDFTAAAEKVTGAVVHIRSLVVNEGSRNGQQIPEDLKDFFGPFFRDQQPNGRGSIGTGSGVIINSDGYVVTNNHVIANAKEVEVTLNDNRSYVAEVIGTDPLTDIALLKIDEDGLPFLTFSDSEKVRVGEWVLAVGNPYNLNSTVTAGIVSAKARSIGILASPNSQNGVNESIESFIQTDAAVNPGNSGGALVNLNGLLIGINTAIASPTGSYSGYSFAVPSNIVQKVIEDLKKYGTVQRGWLGVTIRDVNDEFAREEDLSVIQGAYISDIAENSGAIEAGVEVGDVIVSVDGRNVKKNSDVIGYIGQKRPGDIVELTIDRRGKEKTFDVELKNREGNVQFIEKKEDIIARLGAEFEEVDTKTLKRLGMDHGVQVKELGNGILRSETKMRPGFIITKIGDQQVKNIKEVKEAFESASGGILIEGRYEEYSKTEYYAIGLN